MLITQMCIMKRPAQDKLGTADATLSTSSAHASLRVVFTNVESKMVRKASQADNKTKVPKKRQSNRITPFSGFDDATLKSRPLAF